MSLRKQTATIVGVDMTGHVDTWDAGKGDKRLAEITAAQTHEGAFVYRSTAREPLAEVLRLRTAA
jgi:hypothetical protein